jgi:hypothetical protein
MPIPLRLERLGLTPRTLVTEVIAQTNSSPSSIGWKAGWVR